MHMTAALAILLVLCSELCSTIRVPVVWKNENSEVNQHNEPNNEQEEFSVDVQTPVPVEYFEYPAKKPQFAVDVAAFHGVQSPEDHYKAYPIRPYTGNEKPQLGKHRIFNQDNILTRPFQEYANKNEGLKRYVTPVSSNYEVFHPYKAEIPALQEIYKDPILDKIRNDLEQSKNRLQTSEMEAGKPDVTKSEYLESPKKTDEKFVPHRNVPAPFEHHRPERRPVYYRPPPIYNNRDHFLNQKLRHQWNQGYKIRPVHYRPVKNHLHKLRQNHALKYDDERNEYPQISVTENYAEPQDGYDIYEKGKDKYVQLRNNVDESINKAVVDNRPADHHNLEMQNEDSDNNQEEEDEFIPIKNYAQVRKTETTKHLPRTAALADAETYDEILNAPRLKEAVKSTKAQTVYSEEGYEDSAYDHAGEQKHASEHEGHGGYLKEKELSGGKYKIPSISASYEDGKGSVYRDQLLHGKKHENSDKDNQEETEEEDFSEDEQEQSVDANIYQNVPDVEANQRNKREKNNTDDNSKEITDKINDTNSEHDVNKREASLDVPAIDINSSILNEKEILTISNQKIEPKKDYIRQKYPYYFKNLKAISMHSPLRYAENLKLIPKKSKGGTEFYDSRSYLECSEVEDVDPLPEKLKQNENPNDDDANESEKGEKSFDTAKTQPRLRGLGDKIDCFKAKYFGENPLDSPFFKEETISNPEPVTLPNLETYKVKQPNLKTSASKSNNIADFSENEQEKSGSNIFILLDKLRSDIDRHQNISDKLREELRLPLNITDAKDTQQSSVYIDVIKNIKNNLQNPLNESNITKSPLMFDQNVTANNITYDFFKNKEDVTKFPAALRVKRATQFVYEPYKIIRDSQVQDSKKTTTTSNISPLIKQLQSSRVVDRVTKPNQEKEQLEKHVKRNVNTSAYKNVGKNDRKTISGNNGDDSVDTTFVDVSVDQRRGEPRYELRPSNHKSQYTPITNKKSISMDDYKAQTNIGTKEKLKDDINPQKQSRSSQIRQRKVTERPFFDVSKYMPQTTEVQNVAASNSVRRTAKSSSVPETKYEEQTRQRENGNKDRDYEEYSDDDEEEEDDDEITTTTTTTQTPVSRRKSRVTTTEEPHKNVVNTEIPKLRLVTRFRNYKPDATTEKQYTETEKPLTRNRNEHFITEAPKYREKKKKSSKSTLVTDTQKYGEGDDDMKKDEVDAMIGVKQDMDDYMPVYEKEIKNEKQLHEQQSSEESDRDYEDDDDEEDFIDEIDDEDEDDDDEDDDDEDDEEDDEEEIDEEELHPEAEAVTTPEPTKRTLVITTDSPAPTVAARSAKLETKPIITKKKIEIHKELPVNKSSPHMTQFKQDITEVEIIKEIPTAPKKKPQKNIEALELYKDDHLAKNINKLGDIEIFKEDLDIKNGPRHGGNYRSIVTEEPVIAPAIDNDDVKVPKQDAVASQSENKKQIELDDHTQSKRNRGRHFNSRNSGRSSKYVELNDPPNTRMHGGNLKYNGKDRKRGGNRSEKLIEFEDDHDADHRDSTSNSKRGHSYSGSRNERPMHGGNYRSAKLVEKPPEVIEETPKRNSKDASRNAAVLLNSFVQAAPILTTAPSYILDPSKRMYYYVDV